MKSPVSYFGSKQSIAPWIVDMLPAHEHYVEPFAGGLSVLLAKRPSRMETVNDLDGELMCVTPSTRILTADYRWVRAGDVHVGDRLVGFDEHNASDKQPGRRVPTSYRRWRGADVEAVRTVRKPCYRLVFTDGTEVTASADHMWMCSGPPGRHPNRRKTAMGWSGANSIFNPVARALIEAGSDDTTKRKVLGDLINGLQQGDWDTEDESLEDFLDEPAIVAAFHDHGVHLSDRRCCQQTAIQAAQDLITVALAERFSDGAVEDRMSATPQEAAEVAIAAIRDLIGNSGEQQ